MRDGLPRQRLLAAARHGAVFAALYGGFGVASPFMPALIESRGISPELIGTIFALGTAARLVASPLAGRLADRFQSLRGALAMCAIGTAAAVTLYLPAQGFAAILLVSIAHAIWLAPAASLADALALGSSRRPGAAGFEYGWVRGGGSAAFVAGLMASGFVVGAFGLTSIVWLQAVLMLAVPLALLAVPPLTERAAAADAARAPDDAGHDGRAHRVGELVRSRRFVLIVVIAALVLGSHAMHDTFSVIRWRAAGIAPWTISLLWSLAVAAEVVVFLYAGPRLLARVSPAACMQVAAVLAAARWAVSAVTTEPLVLTVLQPMHGVTFALLHLACMRILAQALPTSLLATGQAVFGTVGVGVANVVMTFAAGWIVSAVGYSGFLIMSLVSLCALPFAWRLSALTPSRA